MSVLVQQFSRAKARRFLRQVRRKKCWSVRTGGAAGGSISLSLGKKMRLAPALAKLSFASEPGFEGEIEVLAWCSWRLQTSKRVIATDSTPEAERRTAVSKLKGRVVEGCWLFAASGDLIVFFSGDLRLHFIADYLPESEAVLENWQVAADSKTLYLSAQGRLGLETADSSAQ